MQTQNRSKTLRDIYIALEEYHQRHKESTTYFFHSSNLDYYLEQYLDQVLRFFPMLEGDASRSCAVTKLVDSQNELTYTIRFRGMRTCGITNLVFNKATKQISVQI